ncbi:MAG: hypothetical protein Q7S02_02475 [bacterium]|nr:hypothetical protein [bacterium]
MSQEQGLKDIPEDSFVLLNKKLDTEIGDIRAKADRLEHQLQQVASHLNLKLQEA